MDNKILEVNKQIKRIDYIARITIGILILFVIPLFNVATLFLFPPMILVGLTMYLYFETKKHYNDSFLLTNIIISIIYLVAVVFFIKVLGNFGNDISNVYMILWNIFTIMTGAAMLVMTTLSRKHWKREVDIFKFITNQKIQYYTLTLWEINSGIVPQTRLKPLNVDEKNAGVISRYFIYKAIIVIFTYFIIMQTSAVEIVLVPFIIVMTIFNVDLNSTVVSVYANLYILTLFASVFTTIFFEEISGSLRRFNIINAWKVPVMVGLGYLITVVINIILAITRVSIEQSQNQQTLESYADLLPIGIAISTVILAPIVEELVFRQGMAELIYRLITKIKSSHPKVNKVVEVTAISISIVLTAFVFAFIHVMDAGDYLAIFGYIGMSLALTTLYFFTKRNVIYTIAGHMIINIVATIMIL